MLFKQQKKHYLTLQSSYELTKNWLINSGIFVSDVSDPNYGGVYSFFDEKKKEFSILYPEITGFFIITSFLSSYRCD